jgi:hypothetical protein
LWCDHGDNLSLLYAGTKALKRDVTRQGKRTGQGALEDGMNSMLRYYLNNRVDPLKQRGLDIVLGNDQGVYTPLPVPITAPPMPMRRIPMMSKWKAGAAPTTGSAAKQSRSTSLRASPQPSSSSTSDTGALNQEDVGNSPTKQLSLDDMLNDLIRDIRQILV